MKLLNESKVYYDLLISMISLKMSIAFLFRRARLSSSIEIVASLLGILINICLDCHSLKQSRVK